MYRVTVYKGKTRHYWDCHTAQGAEEFINRLKLSGFITQTKAGVVVHHLPHTFTKITRGLSPAGRR